MSDADERLPLRVLDQRYELMGELASGGMASVYLAQMRNRAGFRRLFAVKLCHPHMRDDPEFVAMFLDEARLAAMIHHPNVVPTVDVGQDGDELYLVMDYVEGERLSSLVRAVRKANELIPTPIVLRIMVDVLAGLGAAHDLVDDAGRPMKLVHRDVSPQNVMVGLDGVARLMDFGIARAEARATVTRDGAMKGKLAYMAPEQIVAGDTVDRRADLFAMGVVLWELLTGKRLLTADSQAETIHRVLHTRMPPPSRGGAKTSVLDAITLRALERSRDLRFESAGEMARAIEALGEPIASTTEVAEYADRWLGAEVRRRRERLIELSTGNFPLVSASGAKEVLAQSVVPAQVHRNEATRRLGKPLPPSVVEASKRGARSNKVTRGLVALVLAALAVGGVSMGVWVAGDQPDVSADTVVRATEPPADVGRQERPEVDEAVDPQPEAQMDLALPMSPSEFGPTTTEAATTPEPAMTESASSVRATRSPERARTKRRSVARATMQSPGAIAPSTTAMSMHDLPPSL